MTREFCDRCDNEVRKDGVNRAEVVKKVNVFSDDNLRVQCLCPGCAERLKNIIKEFMKEGD